jgi:hypothetical protein
MLPGGSPGSDQANRAVDNGPRSRGLGDENGRKDEHVQQTRRTEFNLGLAVALLVAVAAWFALVYAVALLIP